MKRYWLLALLFVSCAKTTVVVAPTQFAFARSPVPWPNDTPACAVDGMAWDQMCAPSFDVRDDAGVVIARVERTTYTHVRWSQFPLLGASRDARIEATAGGLRVEGVTTLDKQSFTVSHSIALAGRHARIPSGSQVSILGTTGAKVIIEVPTGFVNPSRVEAAIGCGSFGGGVTEAMPSGPPFAKPRTHAAELRSSPQGPIVLTFVPSPSDAWVWGDRQGDFVHVVGGHHAWRKLADRTSFVFDGWIAIDQVAKVDAIDADWDSGCDPLDLKDSCPQAWVSRKDAIVRASPSGNGKPVATLVHGAYVVPLEKRDGFTAFHTPNDEIIAPKGTHFWIADGDLESGCVGAAMEDGCPCVP